MFQSNFIGFKQEGQPLDPNQHLKPSTMIAFADLENAKELRYTFGNCGNKLHLS